MVDFIIFMFGFILGLSVSLWLKDSLNVDIKWDRDGVKTKKAKLINENNQD